ncbi:MAG: polysaccharide biosynthesis/export family protein [Opitutales bacterium]|nr:polysaccharide biosynthesis/export family protein [Opitutales bacterium]
MDQNTKVKTSENYKISALDVLQFRIIGELETDCEVRVAYDGSITLPYIGTVSVKDKTVAEARQFLYEQYASDYYVDPQIDLVIVAYKQKRVNVQGMVNRQGFVIFPPEEKMTLLGAIALAGGWGDNRLAQRSAVRLTRTDENGNSKTFVIDADNIGQDDWQLEDGDLIYVPERKW